MGVSVVKMASTPDFTPVTKNAMSVSVLSAKHIGSRSPVRQPSNPVSALFNSEFPLKRTGPPRARTGLMHGSKHARASHSCAATAPGSHSVDNRDARTRTLTLANRFGRSKKVTIAAEKVSTGFAQLGELFVPPLEVSGRKITLAPDKIPDETC